MTFRRVEPYLTPLFALGGLYLVSLIALSLLLRLFEVESTNLVLNHLASLLSVVFATFTCVMVLERGRWSLGLFVEPRRALRGLVRGVAFGLLIVGATDAAIVSLSEYRHVWGSGMNWTLLLTLIVPAAFGEELLFRGYVLQKLHGTNAGYAVLVTSLLFALAHAGNPAMSLISFANILLAGVLLALMWVWDRSLWMPTWGHITWNVLSGPVLGHELSGLDLGPTVLAEVDPGPAWLTGGEFGIEASVVLTMVECLVIVLLLGRIRARERALTMTALEAGEAPDRVPDIMSGASAKVENEVGSK